MANGEETVDVAAWYANLPYDQWVTLPVTGRRPFGRYKHAAAVVGDKLYVSGGSRNGRRLSDIQVLDFTSSTWSSMSPVPEPNAAKSENDSLLEVFPATLGHQMIIWENKLLVIDGRPKSSKFVTVLFLDPERQQCGIVECTGEIPDARSGQSVTLYGSKLIMFGGEDVQRKLLNDLYVLDLETTTWSKIQATQPPPSPRYDHAAAVHAEHYLLVFGGCSHSTCFNDFHVLDLHTMEWSHPEIRGDYVTPRAGHSGTTIDESWFIVGGGDNKSGASETLILDMSKLVWSVVTKVNGRDPLASEGISVCSASIDGNNFLIAFGGYNGKYNNEVLVMRPKLKDSARPKIYQSPAAAAAAASVTAAYSYGSGKQLENGFKTEHPKQETVTAANRTNEAKRLLESSIGEMREENSMLRAKIDDLNSTHGELSKELVSIQGQLVAERSRCFKLEAQIAELQSALESLPSLEAEVQSLRDEKSKLEEDVEHDSTIQRQGSQGVWQWFSASSS